MVSLPEVAVTRIIYERRLPKEYGDVDPQTIKSNPENRKHDFYLRPTNRQDQYR
jgi:hypothetical protein